MNNWSESRAILYGIILIILLDCYILFKAWKKKTFKVTLKTTVNNIFFWLSLLWTVYFMIIISASAPTIVTLTQHIVDSSSKVSDPNSLGIIMIKATPLVYVITSFIIIGLVLKKSINGWINYTNIEKEYLKNKRKENRDKLKAFFNKHNIPFLKDRFNNDKVNKIVIKRSSSIDE